MPSRPAARLALWCARHDLTPDRWRPALLRSLGYEISKDVVIFEGIRLSGEGQLTIGVGSFVSHDCFIDCSGGVTIGARVALAAGVRIISSGHRYDDPDRRAGARTRAAVHVGDGAWLGAGCSVLPGVSVGPGVVVAAGAVVTRDCQPHGLYAGVPARRIRELPAARPG